jgi:hypothetical protein
VCGVLDNILHLRPLWLLGTVVLRVFLEEVIFIGFLVPGEIAAVLAGVGQAVRRGAAERLAPGMSGRKERMKGSCPARMPG